MAQRISDLVGDVKLLSSAVSHDLRTPLAAIRFGLDTLQEEDDPILRKTFEQRISKNVDEMIELVEVLLNYARLDQNLVTLDKAPVDVSMMLSQMIKNLHHDHIQFEIAYDESKDFKVWADKSYLSMLFKNLLQNAIQHSHNKVRINMTVASDHIQATVSDDGMGIESSQREQIIKPFVRGNSEHKGYGIGLAVVQRILHWHNGRLIIDNDPQLGGARFTVSLPYKA
jgi:two-component system, OmpR family, sensor kinase